MAFRAGSAADADGGLNRQFGETLERAALESAIEKVLEGHRVTVSKWSLRWACSCGVTAALGSIEGVRKMNRAHLSDILAETLCVQQNP